MNLKNWTSILCFNEQELKTPLGCGLKLHTSKSPAASDSTFKDQGDGAKGPILKSDKIISFDEQYIMPEICMINDLLFSRQ